MLPSVWISLRGFERKPDSCFLHWIYIKVLHTFFFYFFFSDCLQGPGSTFFSALLQKLTSWAWGFWKGDMWNGIGGREVSFIPAKHRIRRGMKDRVQNCIKIFLRYLICSFSHALWVEPVTNNFFRKKLAPQQTCGDYWGCLDFYLLCNRESSPLCLTLLYWQ